MTNDAYQIARKIIETSSQAGIGLVGFYDEEFPDEPFNWYWYFAVLLELRGQGKGQEILTTLIDKYKGETCVLDMESPKQECENKAQRERRHEFYLRNGFRDTNLYKKFDLVEMTIMMIGEGTFTMQDWDDIVSELREFWRWDWVW